MKHASHEDMEAELYAWFKQVSLHIRCACAATYPDGKA